MEFVREKVTIGVQIKQKRWTTNTREISSRVWDMGLADASIILETCTLESGSREWEMERDPSFRRMESNTKDSGRTTSRKDSGLSGTRTTPSSRVLSKTTTNKVKDKSLIQMEQCSQRSGILEYWSDIRRSLIRMWTMITKWTNKITRPWCSHSNTSNK